MSDELFHIPEWSEQDWKLDTPRAIEAPPPFQKRLMTIDARLRVLWGECTRWNLPYWVLVQKVPPEFWGADWDKKKYMWHEGRNVDVLGPRYEYEHVYTLREKDGYGHWVYQPLDERLFAWLMLHDNHREFDSPEQMQKYYHDLKEDYDKKVFEKGKEQFADILRDTVHQWGEIPFGGQPATVLPDSDVKDTELKLWKPGDSDYASK